MQGYRKLILGVVYLIVSGGLAAYALKTGADLFGLSTFVASMTSGVFVFVRGNIKEHEAKKISDEIIRSVERMRESLNPSKEATSGGKD